MLSIVEGKPVFPPYQVLKDQIDLYCRMVDNTKQELRRIQHTLEGLNQLMVILEGKDN